MRGGDLVFMESRAHQEWRSRQQFSWRAAWNTALCVGGITFIISGGSPWSTAGTMNAIVGRDVPWSFPAILFGHFVVSFAYAVCIGLAIYRLRVFAALFVGTAVALLLSVVSREVFSTLGWVMQSPEIRAVLTHLVFGLFASAVYKGASVPPPLHHVDDASGYGTAWR